MSPGLSSGRMEPFPGAHARLGIGSQPDTGSFMMFMPKKLCRGLPICLPDLPVLTTDPVDGMGSTSGTQNDVGYLELQRKKPQHQAVRSHNC